MEGGQAVSIIDQIAFDQIADERDKAQQENKLLKDRIKRLEEELNELRSDEARLLNSNGELERRIKLILEAGDKMFPWSERVGQEFWTEAKEAMP
jgi:cell division septum initiation protein DivIVA